jgi:phosphoglycerate-specific signal transduction histidine kinase
MDNDLNSELATMSELKAQKKAIEFELKKVETKIKATESQIFEHLDAMELTQAANPAGQSVLIVESVVPQVSDWELFHEHIRTTGDFFLLQKRAAVLTCRESFQMGRVIPGVLPYTLRKLTYKET